MSTQDLRLFDLLDGFEMTKSEYDWLERRFENMTVKEALLFRGAMQIERPEKTCDVMQVINSWITMNCSTAPEMMLDWGAL